MTTSNTIILTPFEKLEKNHKVLLEQLIKWAKEELALDITKKENFSELYSSYINKCKTAKKIPASKKLFSSFIRNYYEKELEYGAITIENRGGVKVFGVYLVNKQEDLSSDEILANQLKNTHSEESLKKVMMHLNKLYQKPDDLVAVETETETERVLEEVSA